MAVNNDTLGKEFLGTSGRRTSVVVVCGSEVRGVGAVTVTAGMWGAAVRVSVVEVTPTADATDKLGVVVTCSSVAVDSGEGE